MTSLFLELKQAREALGLSLADIADSTLINVKFLAAIEEGRTEVLPEAYIRAFIREYAAAVGIDPAAAMKRFDKEHVPAAESQNVLHLPQTSDHKEAHYAFHPLGDQSPRFSPRTVTIAVGSVVLLAAIVLLWNVLGNQPAPTVREIPFPNVVKEHETRLTRPEPPPPRIAAIRTDSLTLSVATTDSVWIMVSVDSLPSREYLFRPGARAAWRARERFVLTLGNAGAVQFTLNQKRLGTVGERGHVVRNVVFTRQSLTALK